MLRLLRVMDDSGALVPPCGGSDGGSDAQIGVDTVSVRAREDRGFDEGVDGGSSQGLVSVETGATFPRVDRF